MKKTLIVGLVVSMIATTSAFGETSRSTGTTAVAGQQQQQQTQAQSAATNAGNAQNITFVQQATEQKDLTRTISDVNYNYSGSYEMKNVPGVIAPALTSSNDTCMGSSSLGAAGVGFGVSIGSSWTDDNCVMLKNARELYNMGMKGAAMARMCMDANNKEALELTGFVCPQTKKEQDAAKAEAAKEAAAKAEAVKTEEVKTASN